MAQTIKLLKIIIKHEDKITHKHFCFQHTRDLANLSRVFLLVTISPAVTHEIALDSTQFDDADASSGVAFVAELKEYASHALPKVRVSVLVHVWINSLT